MSWFVLAEFPLDEDLGRLDKALHQQKILHRFTEENGQQKLWLADPTLRDNALQLLQDFKNNRLVSDEGESTTPTTPAVMNNIKLFVKKLPITTCVLIGGLLGYAVVFFDLRSVAVLLLYHPQAIEAGQYWRIITPAFLHFGILHIVFNSMWIWDIGSRLELRMGRLHMVLMFIFSAATSNIAQFYAGQSNMFGGLSGVVYACFGCIFVIHYFSPSRITFLPPWLYVAILIWLIAGFTGVIDLLIDGSIANWAHAAGLIAGLLYGFIFLGVKSDGGRAANNTAI